MKKLLFGSIVCVGVSLGCADDPANQVATENDLVCVTKEGSCLGTNFCAALKANDHCTGNVPSGSICMERPSQCSS